MRTYSCIIEHSKVTANRVVHLSVDEINIRDDRDSGIIRRNRPRNVKEDQSPINEGLEFFS